MLKTINEKIEYAVSHINKEYYFLLGVNPIQSEYHELLEKEDKFPESATLRGLIGKNVYLWKEAAAMHSEIVHTNTFKQYKEDINVLYPIYIYNSSKCILCSPSQFKPTLQSVDFSTEDGVIFLKKFIYILYHSRLNKIMSDIDRQESIADFLESYSEFKSILTPEVIKNIKEEGIYGSEF